MLDHSTSPFAGQPVRCDIPLLPNETLPIGETTPKAEQRHYEVSCREFVRLAVDPLAGRLAKDGFDAMPADCGYRDKRLVSYDGERFKVSVVNIAVAQIDPCGRFPIVINDDLDYGVTRPGWGFSVAYWISGSNGRDQAIEDAAFVLKHRVRVRKSFISDAIELMVCTLMPELQQMSILDRFKLSGKFVNL